MNNYPEVVAKIAGDYLERVKSHLRLVPAHEREDFLREIQSHLYEAYQQTPGDDDVARILTVMRNFGEPAEVVSDRLPGTMVRSGARCGLPLYIAGGLLVALFGIPLGFGGLGVLVGLLAALSGLVIAFYAFAGSILLSGAIVMLAGMTRLLLPGLWDRLIAAGFIQMNGPPGEFFDQLSSYDQGLALILIASLLGAAGFGLLLLGRRLFRGLRFISGLAFDRSRLLALSIRRRLQWKRREAPPVGGVSFAGNGG